MEISVHVEYPSNFPNKKPSFGLKHFKGLDKAERESVRQLADMFQNDKCRDVFVVLEFVTRVGECMRAIKQEHEDRVQQRLSRENQAQEEHHLAKPEQKRDIQILKVIVEEPKELTSQDKSKDDKKKQVAEEAGE